MLHRLWQTTFGVVALVAIVFSAATVAIGSISYVVTHEALEQQLDHRLVAETATLLHEAQEGGVTRIAHSIRLRKNTRTISSLDYLLVDRSGHPIVATVHPLTPLKEGHEELFRFQRGEYIGVGQALATPVSGGLLIVIADRQEINEIDRTLEALFASALGAMLALGIGAAALIGWLTRHRLSGIDKTAKAIISGDLTQRVKRDGSESEFDRLAGTLNHMLDRINSLMDNLKQVSSDVAHDLRTPLTRLCNHLERGAASENEAERTSAILAARDQANELLEIFSALLRIAEIEGLAKGRGFTSISLTNILEDMAETYRPDFEAQDRQLVTTIPEELTVQGDRRLLAQAISNLLENVLRHTPVGTTATLSAHTDNSNMNITLIDNGPSVSEHDAGRLFQRFARAEASRTTAGHGLGLALVRAIAVCHDGDARLIQTKGGFGIVITLPQKK